MFLLTGNRWCYTNCHVKISSKGNLLGGWIDVIMRGRYCIQEWQVWAGFFQHSVLCVQVGHLTYCFVVSWVVYIRGCVDTEVPVMLWRASNAMQHFSSGSFSPARMTDMIISVLQLRNQHQSLPWEIQMLIFLFVCLFSAFVTKWLKIRIYWKIK